MEAKHSTPGPGCRTGRDQRFPSGPAECDNGVRLPIGGCVVVRGGELRDVCGHAPVPPIPGPIPPVPARDGPRPRQGRRTPWRGAPVLVVLALVAAACSSAPTVGTVGSTLPAMSGTVTLDKVISPAYVEPDSKGPSFGHKLVAVVLTVHGPDRVSGAVRVHLQRLEAHRLHQARARRARARPSTRSPNVPCTRPSPRWRRASTPDRVRRLPAGDGGHPGGAEDHGQGQGGVDDRRRPDHAGRPAAKPPWLCPAGPGRRRRPHILWPRDRSRAIATTAHRDDGRARRHVDAAGATPARRLRRRARSHPVAITRHHVGSGKVADVRPLQPQRAGQPGARVAISGRRLTAVTEVTFNGVPRPSSRRSGRARSWRWCRTAPASGPIVVTTPAGALTSPRAFVVL